MVNVRALVSADAQAFSDLRRQVVASAPVQMGISLQEELARPLSEFEGQLATPAPSIVFGAFAEGNLVATAGLSRPTTRASGAHKAVLWGVLTAPSYRRQSLARGLSERAIAHALSTGARRIYLYVFVPNEPAVRLYESLGFVETGREPEVLNVGGVYYDVQHMSRGYAEA
jgi:RimJ/RimL family protein N-acetyltransferase